MYYKKIHFTKEYIEGEVLMKNSSVSICSIVRNCQRNLEKNIPRVEKLRSLFKDSEIIVFENDSKDNTLKILKRWERESYNVHVFSDTFKGFAISLKPSGNENPYYSISRIEKMVIYRNKYIHFLNNHGIERDYVIVIDLDIANFYIYGIIHSFGTSIPWNSISSNGISISSTFRKQYHDSYALIEYGKLNQIQTEQSIKLNRIRYSFLKQGMPLLQVDSAYGGLAIYKWISIKDIYYSYLINNDSRVQCKSEHVGFHMLMKENGHDKIFINPTMIVKYRSISLQFLLLKLKEKLYSNIYTK
jgi:glycosyltransferase involved in cell wall biosynthesis